MLHPVAKNKTKLMNKIQMNEVSGLSNWNLLAETNGTFEMLLRCCISFLLLPQQMPITS